MGRNSKRTLLGTIALVMLFALTAYAADITYSFHIGSDIYKTLNGKPGLSFRIQISKDKQSYAKVLQADFSKIKKDEFATIYGDQGEEETAEFKKYLNGKPQDLFTYFKDQGLKEEK